MRHTMNTRQKIRLAGILLAALVLLILLVQNRQEVAVSFLVASLTMPLALHLGFVFLLGVIVGLLLSFWLIGRRPAVPLLEQS